MSQPSPMPWELMGAFESLPRDEIKKEEQL